MLATSNSNKTKKLKTPGYTRKILLIYGGLLIFAITVLIWFINSSFWPWPSQHEIDRRLDEVISSCMNNESSRGCSTLQEKYEITFKYCHSLADIPEIGKNIPIYGVSFTNKFTPYNLEGVMAEDYRITGEPYERVFPYYGCNNSINSVGNNNTENLLHNPSTLVLFALSKTPYKSVNDPDGNGPQCNNNVSSDKNSLYTQIPNFDVIWAEYDTIYNTYKMCNQGETLQNEWDKINKKFVNYSQNKAVQLFYQQYGKWTDSPTSSTQYYGKSFNNTSIVAPGTTLIDFSEMMHKAKINESFTSKNILK